MEFLGSSVQAEQLKEIGSRLSQERQSRSLSLEAVATKTFIPLRLLNAIEAGRIDLLPEPVFIQGFIRRYADLLGLDGSSISKEFSVNLAVPVTPDVLSTADSTAEPPSVSATPTAMDASRYAKAPTVVEADVDRRASEPSFKLSPEIEAKLPWIAGGVLGLGAIVLLASTLNHPKSSPKAAQKPASVSQPSAVAPSAQKPPVVANSSVGASASPTPSPLVSPTSPAAIGPVAVKMNLTEDSWVEVKVDGQTAYEGTLPKGTQKTWSGKSQVVIRAGNAGGVSVSYNNSPAKPLGAAGDVETASFPPSAGQ